MNTTAAGPSAMTPGSTLTLLSNLPITHSSFISLLVAHAPFANPSSLPSSAFNKLLGRVNSAVLARDNESERKTAWAISKEVILQDQEGYVLNQWGKNWVTAALGALTTVGVPAGTLLPPLELLSTVITASSTYPSFEREAIHPVMGKVAVTLSRLLERSVAEGISDWNTFAEMVQTTQTILEHSPASFRPVAPTLRTFLRGITICLPAPSPDAASASTILSPPLEIRQSAAGLLAALPATAGKAQSTSAWGTAVREALGGIGEAMNAIVRDGLEEEPVKISPPALPAGIPSLPADPSSRLGPSLDWLEGFTEEAIALLQYPTSRAVPVPIAHIVSAGLRCLNLTLDTPTVPYISPQQHAALLASLPRVWTVGLLLLASVITAVGDHILPHLSGILDHTVWLTERVPTSMTQTHLQLLRFHQLIFTLLPPALAPIDYPTRLVRYCLNQYSPLLDSKPSTGLSSVPSHGGGKRGKKRARGAEDGLIGGLEGREASAIPERTVEVALASLKLVSLLHPTTLLSPTLLTFSIRLHLSLYLHLGSASSYIFAQPSHLAQLHQGVHNVLQDALYMVEGEQGTSKGLKSAILSVLDNFGDGAALLLHPSLPAMNRPQPPLSALHFFAKETEEERKLRRELGCSTTEDSVVVDDDGEMEVDQPDVTSEAVRTVQEKTRQSHQTQLPQPMITAFAPAPTMSAVTETVSESVSVAPVATAPLTTPMPVPTIAQVAQGTTPAAVEAAEVASAFMSVPASRGGETRVVETFERTVVSTAEDDDEPLPELDSGSSDEGEMDDEEEEEEEIEE